MGDDVTVPVSPGDVTLDAIREVIERVNRPRLAVARPELAQVLEHAVDVFQIKRMRVMASDLVDRGTYLIMDDPEHPQTIRMGTWPPPIVQEGRTNGCSHGHYTLPAFEFNLRDAVNP